MLYFVDFDLDLEVTFQGQKEKMLILSSGHLFSRGRPLETCAKYYQPPRRLRTQSVKEFLYRLRILRFCGPKFFEIIALTLAIRFSCVCHLKFLIEVNMGYPLVPKSKKLKNDFRR